jgi:hypothetical protein
MKERTRTALGQPVTIGDLYEQKTIEDLLVELQNAVSNPDDFANDTYNYLQGLVDELIDTLDTDSAQTPAAYPVISFYGSEESFEGTLTAEQIGNFMLDVPDTTLTHHYILGEKVIVTRTK